MKKLLPILFLPLLLLSTSCLRPAVNTDKPQGDINFSKYKTYAFLPTSDSVEFSEYNRAAVERNSIAEINDELGDRGLIVDQDNPDLLILTHYLFQRRTELVQQPVYSTYSYYRPGFYNTGFYDGYYYNNYNTVTRVVGYNTREVNYTEGTIAVDVIDRKTNKIVWRGWSDDRVTREGMDESVKMYMDNIFDEFPLPDLDKDEK